MMGLSMQLIWNINNPPNFPNLILKNCNKLIPAEAIFFAISLLQFLRLNLGNSKEFLIF